MHMHGGEAETGAEVLLLCMRLALADKHVIHHLYDMHSACTDARTS